jgi:hypothetical protein
MGLSGFSAKDGLVPESIDDGSVGEIDINMSRCTDSNGLKSSALLAHVLC